MSSRTIKCVQAVFVARSAAVGCSRRPHAALLAAGCRPSNSTQSLTHNKHTHSHQSINRSKGKKGGKKKAVDPFTKKDWYDVKAPSMFAVRNLGKTLVTRTQGTKVCCCCCCCCCWWWWWWWWWLVGRCGCGVSVRKNRRPAGGGASWYPHHRPPPSQPAPTRPTDRLRRPEGPRV